VISNTLILGDFNIDYKVRFDVEYHVRDLFNSVKESPGKKPCAAVKVPTWSCVVLDVNKESIQNHVWIGDDILLKK
jgi:hypothetical protein